MFGVEFVELLLVMINLFIFIVLWNCKFFFSIFFLFFISNVMNNLIFFVCLKVKGNLDIMCFILDSNKLFINN